jgi:predicted amidophosphoribosyltransferase
MKSVPIWFHLQESSVVCPKCGSAIRVAHDLCLGCMLSLGMDVETMGVDRKTDEALAELLGEMDGLGMLISS